MNRQLRRHPVSQQPAKSGRQAEARMPKMAPQQPRPSRGLLKPYWLSDITSELRKVQWPTRQDAWNLTVVVIVISAAMGLILGGVDLFFSWLVEQILF